MFGGGEENPFAKMGDVDPAGQRRPYLLEGNYLLKIERCKIQKARDRRRYYLVEMEIIESDNPARPAGMGVSWMTDIDSDMGLINIKRFICAASGLDPNSKEAKEAVGPEEASMTLDESQPLAGELVGCNAQLIQTQKGTDFTECRWVPAQDAAA